MFALALRTFIKILGRVLGGDRTNLKDQIITARFDPSYSPPTEESPNPNSIKVGDAILHNPAGDPLGIGGEVVVRREEEAARFVKVDGEFAGGVVEAVREDVGGE